METFKHTHRSALLYFFLNAITLGIFGAAMFGRIKKEYEEMAKDSPNKKKIGSFAAAYFLGFPTLGIYPLVLGTKLVSAIGELAKEKGMERPRITGKFFILWVTLGADILVGPFIAMHRFLLVLNALETKENEARALAIEAEKARLAGIATIEAATKEPVLEEPLPETPAPRDPVKDLLEKYASCPEGRFKVRFEKGKEPLRSFQKKEDAMAFARELASCKNTGLRYVKLK